MKPFSRTRSASALLALVLFASACSGEVAASEVPDVVANPAVAARSDLVRWGTSSALPGEDLSETGASMAGIRLAQIGQELLYTESAAIDSLIDKVATDEGELELIRAVNEVLGPLRASLATAEPNPTWMREIPMTVDVVDFDEEAGTAVVEVWVWQFMSRAGVVDGELSCGIATYGLVWSASDQMWLFDSHEQGPGPCPGLNVERHPSRSTAFVIDEALEGHHLVDGTAGAGIGVE